MLDTDRLFLFLLKILLTETRLRNISPVQLQDQIKKE